MIRPSLAAALAVSAVAVRAEPPVSLAPALRPVVAAAARGALSSVRNAAYGVDELRHRVQRDISRERSRLAAAAARERAAGLRERVLEEADEFLGALSPEVDRLARESAGAADFRTRLEAVAGHVQSWDAKPVAFLASQAAGALAPTLPDILGPFYRPNAPFRSAISPAGAKGESLTLSGTVRDTAGNPVANALVDVWQADAAGAYDISDPDDPRNARIPLTYRARQRTDAQGRWSFSSVLPGQYEIGEGKWRPRHIHFKFSAPGLKGVTTQLYFDGDPYNAVDPWWKQSNSVPLNGSASAGWTAAFHAVLAP